jgi:hypothetical protein
MVGIGRSREVWCVMKELPCRKVRGRTKACERKH